MYVWKPTQLLPEQRAGLLVMVLVNLTKKTIPVLVVFVSLGSRQRWPYQLGMHLYIATVA